jgi:hypothetical protein
MQYAVCINTERSNHVERSIRIAAILRYSITPTLQYSVAPILLERLYLLFPDRALPLPDHLFALIPRGHRDC